MSDLHPIVCELSRSALQEIMEIDAEVSAVPWSKSVFASEFDLSVSRIFGVRVSGKLAGFFSCHVIEDECHILNIAVRTEFQRRGVGKELLFECLGRFYQEGVRRVFLEVRPSNSRARGLYDSAGFIETGIRQNYYTNNGEDAILLEADLQHFIDTPRG